jgi:class 3 adenylate cyclase
MPDGVTVLAAFVDVRGFTRWAEANEVFINLQHFVQGFLGILQRRFPEPEYRVKPLGDGALLVAEIPEDLRPRDVTAALARLLATIHRVEADFRRHCEVFSQRIGHAAELRLGWGVVRGKVMKVGDDWAGHNLNKCARLCKEARPFGIVIDQDDFPTLPREAARDLVPQVRRLDGIGNVAVWVSPEVASTFVPRERLREQPEVHVAGTCFAEERAGGFRLLLARRSPRRRLYPGKLEGCGGQLRHSETFSEGARRHFRQELGLDFGAGATAVRLFRGLRPLHVGSPTLSSAPTS